MAGQGSAEAGAHQAETGYRRWLPARHRPSGVRVSKFASKSRGCGA